MSYKSVKQLQSVVALILGVLVAVQNASAQQLPKANTGATQEVPTNTEQSKKTEVSAEKPKSGHEGIVVHGHWVIEVKDPDGTLAVRREFENSLVSSGASSLSQMFLGQVVAGDYFIEFGYGTTNFSNVCNAYNCTIVTSLSNLGGQYCTTAKDWSCTPGLNVTASKLGSVTLAGQTVAAIAGTVIYVDTVMLACNDSGVGTNQGPISSSACATESVAANNYAANVFTSTQIAPIYVNAGQQISFTVTISFS